jgi:hypothetical protein
VNLAVADVMISLLNTPFNFVFNLYQVGVWQECLYAYCLVIKSILIYVYGW